MAIEFVCKCGEHFSYPDSMAGKQGRCSTCKSVLEVPMPTFLPSSQATPELPRRPAVPGYHGRGASKKPRTFRHGNNLDSGRNLLVALAILGALAIAGGGIYSAYKDSRKHIRDEPPEIAAARARTQAKARRIAIDSAPSPGDATPPTDALSPGASSIAVASPAAPPPGPPRSMGEAFAPGRIRSMGEAVAARDAPAPALAPIPPAVANGAGPPVLLPMTAEEVAARCRPSIAVIRGRDGQGSGFVVAPGLVATNAHVIRRVLASTIRVSFPESPPDRNAPAAVQVVHFDDSRDLAILAVPTPGPPLPIARDFVLGGGDEVTLIGCPRPAEDPPAATAARAVLEAQIRLDDRDFYRLAGPVSAGHCGSPVVDAQGRVVAIVAAKSAGEEGAICVPASELAAAVQSASGRNPATLAEARARHEASVKLASAVSMNGIAADGRGDRALADFLRATAPSTWLASSDLCTFVRDNNPRAEPYRQQFRRLAGIYTEGEKTIAGATMQFVGKIRDAGLPASCALFLEAALTWAPEATLRGARRASFLGFGESYVALRLGERIGHGEALARMQADPSRVAAFPTPGRTHARPSPDSAAGRLAAAMKLDDEGLKAAAIGAFEAIIRDSPTDPAAGTARNRLNVLRPASKPKSAPAGGRSQPRG